MTPTPAVIALHVDGDNEAAIALYEGCGYVRVVEREVDDAFGRMSRAFGSLRGRRRKENLDAQVDQGVAKQDKRRVLVQSSLRCCYSDLS